MFIILTTVISRRKKSMIHSFTVTFGAKYLTGMVTSVPPYETFSLIKNNTLHQYKNYKNQFENSNFLGMWPLVHVGHVTYSFINMLFISTEIFDDKLRPQIVSVGITANTPLTATEYLYHKWPRICSVCRNHNPFLFYSWLISWVVTKIARRLPSVEQELLTFPEHLS
jgi:hypothetical protein